MELILIAIICLILGSVSTYVLCKNGQKLKEQDATKEKTQFLLDLSKMKGQMEELSSEHQRRKNLSEKQTLDIIELKEKNATLNAMNDSLKKAKEDSVDLYKAKNLDLEAKMESLRNEKNELTKKVIAFEKVEQQRKEQYEEKINRLNLAYEQREQERVREQENKEAASAKKLQELKETWLRHELSVEEKMQQICQRQNIEYVNKEQFPHKGKPDNAVKICNEYVIFDSKSPDGESLVNFPAYIKSQAEAAKKYAKCDDVKNDIFFVVPTNAIHVIEERYTVYGKYRIHVISEDALEPILIGLKKIEDYEFADKLSPEDREKIVTTIGKMAHGMKRRIQVDYFFANEFLSVLTDAENLPQEILTEAQKVERSSKLNPPQEQRSKMIDSKILTKEAEKLVGKALGQEINIDASFEVIDQVPLHKNREDDK